MKPQKPLRALHGAQIREAQNMKQFMFCVPTHPASVPDASSVPINVEVNKQKYHPNGGWYFCLLVEEYGTQPKPVRIIGTKACQTHHIYCG
jgi:hypothetical protein